MYNKEQINRLDAILRLLKELYEAEMGSVIDGAIDLVEYRIKELYGGFD